ncbi:hypothetical protein [Ralstonia solanacearum]|uniref:hypothetical protein n=1 Tax=Ralstonia solanacearum TaxID=305 RepID=UPI001E42F8F6|nr:hypothetical protein [Ralstonia solanacearum]
MFQVGDHVICEDASRTGQRLEAGRTYTVQGARGQFVLLKGMEEIWKAGRELALELRIP